MQINPHIFRGADLRGVVGTDLTPQTVEAIGRAFGAYLVSRGTKQAVVGHDCRQSSPEFAKIIIKTLQESGVDVIDIGLTMVGIFYWSQYHLQSQGGVFVTASHNPAEYNGFKFANDFSVTLVGDGIEEVKKRVQTDDFSTLKSPTLTNNISKIIKHVFSPSVRSRF